MTCFFTLGFVSVRESVGIFIWNMILCFMYAISCAFRREVAFVGEIFYWALLTMLWDPLSDTGGVQGDGAPTRS